VSRLGLLLTECVKREGKAIGIVLLSVHLFPFYLLNWLTFELEFSYTCMVLDLGLPGIKSQGQNVKVKVIRLGFRVEY